MDTKQQALDYISTLGATHALSRTEVLAAYDSGAGVGAAPVEAHHKLEIADILYYLGGGIVFVGIAIFVGQNWEQLSFVTRLLATLGAGIVAFVAASVIGRDERLGGVSAAFYLISALTIPAGLYVWLDQAGWSVFSNETQTLVTLVLLAVYGASFAVFRKTVLLVFTILFGTHFIYAVTNQMVAQNLSFDLWKFYEYRVLLSGLVYMLLGYYFSQGMRSGLSGFLYGFGSLAFLGAALALGGWSPGQNIFWELIYPLLVFGVLYLSVYLKSRSFLVFGTIFLMAYILKITAEYFTEGLGWPLALVLSGLLMIGVGYMSVSINKKYIRAN